MNTSLALILTLPISFAISTALILMLSNPLRTMLDSVCDGDEAVTFWVVYSALMLYVVPMLAGLVIAVGSIPEGGVAPASGMTRILASILAGTFVALASIGARLSKHARSAERFRQMSRYTERGEY